MKGRLVAHRGNAVEFRENSLEAIQSAIDLGVSFVEFDVQMSSDGVPCLIHDAYLGRLYGKDRDAVDTSFLSLKSYGIASLADAMQVLRQHDHVTSFVEIKTDGMERFGREAVVDRVCERINSQNCVVISFDIDAALHARDNGFRIGFVLRDLSKESQQRCDELKPEYVFCDQKHIKGSVWPGFLWVSYEVSDLSTASRLIGYGVDLLETMSVRRMSQLQ